MYSVSSVVLGMLTALMIFLNGVLSQAIGNYAATFVIHLTGFVVVVLVLLVQRGRSPFQRGIQLVLFGGGVLGFLTVVFANISVFELGVSLTVALGLFGQTISAMAIDHFGWFGARRTHFERRHGLGLLLIGAGIVVMALG